MVYGVYVGPGVGYRDDGTTGIPTGGAPQGEYMVASGTHVNSGCCFDYGNAETNNHDNGNGHMEAVNLGTAAGSRPAPAPGPGCRPTWRTACSRATAPTRTTRATAATSSPPCSRATTRRTFELEGANSQSGGLNAWYRGSLPSGSYTGYIPMSLEGAIVLGTGGDNSNSSMGTFFEGVVTTGEPNDAADAEVQANILAAGYTGNSGGAPRPAAATSPDPAASAST